MIPAEINLEAFELIFVMSHIIGEIFKPFFFDFSAPKNVLLEQQNRKLTLEKRALVCEDR